MKSLRGLSFSDMPKELLMSFANASKALFSFTNLLSDAKFTVTKPNYPKPVLPTFSHEKPTYFCLVIPKYG